MFCPMFFVFSGVYLMAAGEVFTSMEHTGSLVKTEAAMIEAFDRIIRSEEEKISNLKRMVAELTRHHSSFKAEDLDPISAFKLIKRLETDWNKAVDISTNRTTIYEYEQVFEDLKRDLMYPTEEDVFGAAGAIVRLQEFYQLNTSDIAGGQIAGIKSSSLTAAECLDIGYYCYDQWNYRLMKEWLVEALKRLKTDERAGENDADHLEWTIYEYLSRALFMDGDLPSSLKLSQDALKVFPGHQAVLHHMKFIQRAMKEIAEEKQKNKEEDGANSCPWSRTMLNWTQGPSNEEKCQQRPPSCRESAVTSAADSIPSA